MKENIHQHGQRQVQNDIDLQIYNSEENKQKEKKNHDVTSRYAITFGEVSILHLGSQSFGTKAEHGFSLGQLTQIRDKMITQYGIKAQLIDLAAKLPQNLRQNNQAAVLYLPGLVDVLFGEQGFADKLYQQQEQVEYDKKFYDNRRKKTLNKLARYNIVFGEEQRQASKDYKQFSIKAFKNLKFLNKLRDQLANNFGQKAKNLHAQGNKYYEDKSGIGFHGDSERKIVICLNLGKKSTLRYYWRVPNSSENRFGPTDITVKHGDVYIMSEKASGHDWRLRSKVRLVHAAGSSKYIGK